MVRDAHFATVEADVANRRRKADILQYPLGVGRLRDAVKLGVTCEGRMLHRQGLWVL